MPDPARLVPGAFCRLNKFRLHIFRRFVVPWLGRFTYRALILMCTALIAGCGFTGGQFLYGLGFGRTKKVAAEFALTSGPVLILVDDDSGTIRSPTAKRHITDEIAQELLRTKAALLIVPPETLDGIRQVQPEFDKRGCREIGEMAGAEQVLWIQVQGFFAEPEFADAVEAAYIQVTIKVINVLEKENRARVRIWPMSSTGTPVEMTLSGARVAELKTADAVAQELARGLAERIAKYFHEYQPGDFESK